MGNRGLSLSDHGAALDRSDSSTEYEYVMESFDEDETAEIPDEAIGVTVDSSGDFSGGIVYYVRYLMPVGGNDGA